MSVDTGCYAAPYYFYYVASIQIYYGSAGFLQFILTSNVFRTTVGTNPYPYLADCDYSLNTSGSNIIQRATTYYYAKDVKYDRWKYTIGGSCQAACNTPILDGINDCAEGYLAYQSYFDHFAGSETYFSNLTRGVSIAAPT